MDVHPDYRPRFEELLADAASTSQAVNEFDVDSNDAESVAALEALNASADGARQALVTWVRTDMGTC